ncbi:MAG TPA: hypothetical protein PKD55_01955 [Bellilinea sp.]|nr:hypothetical protein [Bellilinea sp.]
MSKKLIFIFMLALLLVTAVGNTNVYAQAVYTISGNVFDYNGSGFEGAVLCLQQWNHRLYLPLAMAVDNARGAPSLNADALDEINLDAVPCYQALITTSADGGSFQFSKLPEGVYTIMVKGMANPYPTRIELDTSKDSLSGLKIINQTPDDMIRVA